MVRKRPLEEVQKEKHYYRWLCEKYNIRPCDIDKRLDKLLNVSRGPNAKKKTYIEKGYTSIYLNNDNDGRLWEIIKCYIDWAVHNKRYGIK